jgi:eukaryotic-like serine/threonine-protein kinase
VKPSEVVLWSSGARFGHYEILAPLGKGGMAEVVRGRTLDGPWAGTEVAIKRLLPQLARAPEYVQLFAKEAELSIALRHPNIVQTLDVGAIGDVAYLAMEWVDGRDLGQVLRRCRKQGIALPIDFAVYLARVLLEALEYAHRAENASGAPLHLVHCDVSPSNVFISRVGEVKLGDFGVARVRVKSGVRDAVIAGKPYYLSPEATAGEVTQAVDLWATAVVLFELLTLERPFQGNSPQEVFSAIRAGRRAGVRARRPEVTAGLEAVVDRALAADPQVRFPTAAAFAEALEPHCDERIGTPLAIAALVRGLFGTAD